MTLQKNIDSNSAVEAQVLSTQSSIKPEGIYPCSKNKILTVEHLTCIPAQPVKSMAEKWLRELSQDNLVTFETGDYSGSFAVCVLVNIIRTPFDCCDDAHKMHCRRIIKLDACTVPRK